MQHYGFYAVQLYEKLSAELNRLNGITEQQRTVMRELSEYDFFGETERGSIEPASGIMRGMPTETLTELQYAALMSMPDALKSIYDSYTDDTSRDYDGAFMTAADKAFSLLKENKLPCETDLMITHDLAEICRIYDIPLTNRDNSTFISNRDYFLSQIPEFTEKHDALIDLKEKWDLRIDLNNHDKANVIEVDHADENVSGSYELHADKFGHIIKTGYTDKGEKTENAVGLKEAAALIDRALSDNNSITVINGNGEPKMLEVKNGKVIVLKNAPIKGTISIHKKKRFTAEEKKEYRKSRDKEKKEVYEKLLQKVNDVFDSEEFLNYLKFSAQLHKYSTRNKLLIYMQYPDATFVGSKTAWNKLGGHITSGEKCRIWVYSPITRKVSDEAESTDEDEEKNKPEREIIGYKLMPVYDISQITGVEPPQLIQPLKGEIDKEIFEAIFKGIENVCRIKPKLEPLKKGLDGYFKMSDNTITLNSENSDLQKVLAYIHEAAHSVFHRKDGPYEKESKEDQEIEAEASAYLVCRKLGYETDKNSIPYIATYRQGKTNEELLKTLEITEHFVDIMVNSIRQQLQELEKRRQENEQKVTYTLAPDGDGFVIKISDGSDNYSNERFGSVEEALFFAKKEKLEFDNSEDELREWRDIDILLDKRSLEYDRFDHLPPDRVMWSYYSPDGDDGRGVIVEAMIYDHDMRWAYDSYLKALSEEPKNAGQRFMDSLYTTCKQTVYPTSDDSGKNLDSFKKDPADLMIEGKLVNGKEGAERLIEFFKSTCRSFALYASYRENEGLRKTDPETALKMWENGFEIRTEKGEVLPSYKTAGDSGYARFYSSENELFVCSKLDHRMQELIDRVAASAEELSCYGYTPGKVEGYDPARTAEQNMQTALASRSYTSAEQYFRRAHSSEYGNGEIAEKAKAATFALEELKHLDSSAAEYRKHSRK